MATRIIMPLLGLTMIEGTLLNWLKQDGDFVQKDEIIAEVETDKVNAEIESPGAGLLKIVRQVGEVVPVSELIGYLLASGEEIPQETEGPAAAASPVGAARVAAPIPAVQEALPADNAGGPVRVTPALRRLARELGVELEKLAGTGPEGRITEDDLRRAAAGQAPVTASDERIILLTGVRKVVATRMAASAREAPHFSVTAEAALDALIGLRQALLPAIEASHGFRLSFTDLFVKLTAALLPEFPLLNAFVNDQEVRVKKGINLGVAVDTEEGLVVPVVAGADRLNLAEIGRKLKDLAERARGGRLRLEDLSGGTFTISNLGMFGISSFTSILNPPQTAILGIGGIMPRVFEEQGRFFTRQMVNLTLTVDHRAVDGAMAARFLSGLKALAESEAELKRICGAG